jgi:hypothetical protein
MKNVTKTTGLTIATLTACAMLGAGLLGGCELIAEFDRTKIDAGSEEGGSTDATVGDANGDGGDAGGDAATEAGDGGGDAMSDAPSEAGEGGTSDAGCTTAADCAKPTNDCESATCNEGTCGTTPIASGMSCSSNGGKFCDGNGMCFPCLKAADCTATGTVCATATCSMNKCGTMNTASGTDCSAEMAGGKCDGMGKCAPPSCTNGMQDGTETDIDCGGSCSPCADTKKCKVAADCIDGVCSGTPLTCQAASCTDGVKNGMETDKDCGGGTCPKCADQLKCKVNGDCTNNICFGSPGTCVSCADGVKDGNETDVDCGGAQCVALGKTCALTKGCGIAADCTGAGSCNGTMFTAAPSCTAMVCTAGATTQCMGATAQCNATSGCVQCNAATDCPATGNECIVATCTTSMCGTNDLGMTHVLSTGQTAGDCRIVVCNGAGGTTSIDDATDLPMSTTACKIPQCIGSNPATPGFLNAMLGTSCVADNMPPKKVCRDMGVCVECNGNADCSGGTPTCTNNVCGP